jgi:hypothetical protein
LKKIQRRLTFTYAITFCGVAPSNTLATGGPKLTENGGRTKEYSAHLVSAVAEGDSEMADELYDSLIEQIWRDLNGQISRVKIRQVATDAAARFQDAKVRTFVPIFIRRDSCEQLRAWLDDQA